jgi:hypothetical protein
VALVGGAGAAPEGSASSTEPPGASGDTARPNYMGPSGNGLVGADERGGKPAESRALSVCRPPLSVSRRWSRGLRKLPRWGAERRAGPRYGPAVPSRWRDRSDRKTGQRARRSAPANFGAPLPSVGGCVGFETDNLDGSPPGCAARQRSRTAQHKHGETTIPKWNDIHGTCSRRYSSFLTSAWP